MLDLSIAGDLNVEFLGPNRGFNADYTAEMINDSRFTVPGASDGGAHTKFFTGGAFTTDFLRWLVRDEQKITLEEAHYRLSALPAHAAGFSIEVCCVKARQLTWWYMILTDLMLTRSGSERSPMTSRWRMAPRPAG